MMLVNCLFCNFVEIKKIIWLKGILWLIILINFNLVYFCVIEVILLVMFYIGVCFFLLNF